MNTQRVLITVVVSTILVLLEAMSSFAQTVEFATNVGGSQYTSAASGINYSADTCYSGGGAWSAGSIAIANTEDDVIYQSERWGTYSYNIPLSNGTYDVTLKFAETYWTQVGQRVFHVDIEGSRVRSNLDVLTKVAINTAWDTTFRVTLVNGTLDIAFTAVTDNARLSGIVVQSVASSQAPSIGEHPSNQTVTVGQSASFSVIATGTPTLSYQWQNNSSNIGGATNSSYTTPATVIGDSGSTFRCIVSNSLGTVTSNSAMLTVNSGTSSLEGYVRYYDSTGSGMSSSMYQKNGNIGIGTLNPYSTLVVVRPNGTSIEALSGDSASYTSFKIGRKYPDGTLGVASALGHYSDFATQSDIVLRADKEDLILTAASAIRFGTRIPGQNHEVMTLLQNGNLGIGTTNPDTFKLAVNGIIKAKEILVDNTGWSDFVFDANYKLTPLDELEQQIKEQKHLPGIPSASEVGKNGIPLGEMQAKLLQKIEELTLYLIELKKENIVLRGKTN